jgi:hypothetical protein
MLAHDSVTWSAYDRKTAACPAELPPPTITTGSPVQNDASASDAA